MQLPYEVSAGRRGQRQGGKGLNGIEQARVEALLAVVDAVAAATPLKAVDVRAGY